MDERPGLLDENEWMAAPQLVHDHKQIIRKAASIEQAHPLEILLINKV